ncbi:hypothetical protein [Leucobacter sp. wl10]|uniref:hypothetical protein n=1 Tax=Leucobacter sp. wl10 TaxID=2304677 RepID=UPI000E5A6F81|nr:hypothetical protein [Leucobacter sp. wl10]RGE19026.1 hypothetical protein D1J51_12925 [Leucobacter sp. wl10]
MTSTIEVDALTRAGFTVRARSASELDLVYGHERLVAHLVRQKTSPTRAQLEQTRELPAGEVVLFVTPRATPRVRQLVVQEPRAWLVTHDGTEILGEEPSAAIPDRRTARGRVPWGRYALMRVLVRQLEPRTQLQLAAEIGLTQGAVSGALARLGDAVRASDAGWTAGDPQQLWDAFLTEYPGTQGVRTHWYSRQPFVRQAELLRPLARLSADAGAESIAPWRTPMRAVAYVAEPIDMEALGFSPATTEEATVDVVIPADRTIFATAAAWGLDVADPLLVAWDLRDIGGNDADEAIAQLRRVVLESIPA